MKSRETATGANTARRLLALIIVSACAAVLAVPMPARADWPERPVKLIVTFPPGSANDAAARIFADALSRKWGKPVVVEDKTGAEVPLASVLSSPIRTITLFCIQLPDL